jgi:Fur family ferric uptake transcriptional regulator
MSHENTDYVARLHAYGYRATPQRLLVLDAVCAIGDHANVEQVRAQVLDYDPTISRATVYRALHVLCAVGLVIETDAGGAGHAYRLAGEADHHHLVCRACGTTIMLDAGMLRGALADVEASTGFRIDADHLTLSGLCQQCAMTAAAMD